MAVRDCEREFKCLRDKESELRDCAKLWPQVEHNLDKLANEVDVLGQLWNEVFSPLSYVSLLTNQTTIAPTCHYRIATACSTCIEAKLWGRLVFVLSIEAMSNIRIEF